MSPQEILDLPVGTLVYIGKTAKVRWEKMSTNESKLHVLFISLSSGITRSVSIYDSLHIRKV